MNIGFYTGVSGMLAQQEKMDVVSHNIANVNTIGFKGRRSSFSDLLYTRMNSNDQNQLVGHGAKHASAELMFSPGSWDVSGLPTDFCVTGEGFFAVDNNGTTEYTRNGAFHISTNGSKAYLTASDGSNVLDARGKAIQMALDENGIPKTDDLVDKIGVYTFLNPYGLISSNGSRFLPGDNTGKATALKPGAGKKTGNAEDTTPKVLQFQIENSTVDLGTEMVEVIRSQRAFQLNSRVVQTADQFDEVINNLR